MQAICQTCLVIVRLGVKDLGSAHPCVLVPLIRSCIGQSVGAMMGQFMDKLIQVLGTFVEQGMSTAEKAAAIQAVVDDLKKIQN